MNSLIITSPSFKNEDIIPEKHTGKKGLSPAFHIENLSSACQSIAIIMEDIDAPFNRTVPHWIIWNIPPVTDIPEGIAEGPIVENLEGAFQGVARGKNKYKGPQPSFFKPHRYLFRFYALDCKLDLLFSAEKKHLQKMMKNHMLQTGEITGLVKK